MNYLAVKSVLDAFNSCRGKTQNKFWGLLAILKTLDCRIIPGVGYTFQTSEVSEILDELLSFKEERTDRRGDVWSVLFSRQWLEVIPEIMFSEKPNVYDVATWFYRKHSFSDNADASELLSLFMNDFHFTVEEIKYLFEIEQKEIAFTDTLYTKEELLELIFGKGKVPNTDKFSLAFESYSYLKSNAGNLGQASFVQTLYAGQGPQKCLILTQFDFNKEYRTMETIKATESNPSLQRIFFGAPGTGKSFEVNKKAATLSQKNVFRTTFHPDSDYASFVGAYKPTMKDVDSRVVPVVISTKGTVFEQNQGSFKERKIVYEFVPQEFLKAYVRAWKVWAGLDGDDNTESDGDTGDSKKTSITVKLDGIEIYSGGKMATAARKLLEKYIEFELGNKTPEEIAEEWNSKAKVSYYFFELKEQGNLNSNWRRFYVGEKEYLFYAGINGSFWNEFCEKVKALFDGYGHVVEITTDYASDTNEDPSLFDEEQQATVDDNPNKEVMLVIEEINRGNCAQVFGDVFQLLDRGDKGFSDYPIDPDSDIKDYLMKQFEGLDFTEAQREEINKCFHGKDIASDIAKGQLLVLPNNLLIWATMNTSDQSLFPIDSAFKRRWDWKYMKIKKGKDENGKDLDWKIVIKEKNGNIVKINNEDHLLWWDFLGKINKIIASMTSSADKQLGYFFCKADNKGVIDKEIFVGKVAFYLWNDVFKDSAEDGDTHFVVKKKYEDGREEEINLTYPDFYDDEGEVDEDVVSKFITNMMNWDLINSKNED